MLTFRALTDPLTGDLGESASPPEPDWWPTAPVPACQSYEDDEDDEATITFDDDEDCADDEDDAYDDTFFDDEEDDEYDYEDQDLDPEDD